ncbi:MAG: preprotein translocase subunit SecA [Chloroflexi bacterium RBG_13_54_8]|nr:MAG: preprotein translocase subunit SecA [Chloroflexi bacterium RBG_13_54_8]
MRPISRRQAYEADITYGTNNEFGFDYLRDNMVIDLSQCVQRSLNYAIVDEVDYILIDEARTPLIISGPAEEAAQKYYTFARFVPQLVPEEDYTIDAKDRAAMLTDAGVTKMESLLRREGLLKAPDLYDPSNYTVTQYLDSALKAHVLYRRDKDYVVKDGQVIIVDEFTGRLMFGRRYSEGLHQAIEAKERVKIQRESVTLASITFQNYFRLYKKLAGMTGTAVTEAEEFSKIYHLDVMVIPTNRAMIRTDSADQIYRNEEAKFRAVVNEIESLHNEQRPVLVGTTSIEKSESLSDLLMKRGIPHQVLNAKNHEKEAYIIAQAGEPGAVTVATNMAGRGVDIILGGNPEGRSEEEWLANHNKVVDLGGLHVIGTERHEARRIDNQLRGRSGRQGDPGSSRFYVSLEDDVVHRFGGDRMDGLMKWAGIGDDIPIEHSLISRAIENAQVKVEGYHFEIRKHLVDYDDVANKHREQIYGERKRILSSEVDLKSNIQSMISDELQALVAAHIMDQQHDIEGLMEDASRILPLPAGLNPQAIAQKTAEEIDAMFIEHAENAYKKKEEELGHENMRLIERRVMLLVIDRLWMEHLTMMEHTRQGIGLQAVGHSDPLIAYKREGHALFQGLLANIQHDLVHTIYHVDMKKRESSPQAAASRPQGVAADKKVGRNDPCPCGSGKKYKRCCGK